MRLFGYKTQIGDVGDTMPFYYNGEWHIFLLATPPDTWTVPERAACTLGHIVSKDLVNWEELPDAFGPGQEGDPDVGAIWTGSIHDHKGKFHFFYTGYSHHAKFQQTICHATSDDMITWEKNPNNPIMYADTSEWEPADWRDPYVYYDEEKGCYAMLIAARLKEGLEDRRGCVVVAYSDDLESWELGGTLWAPQQAHCMECPETFSLGGYNYLVFSRYSGDAKTLYRVAKPGGPWEARPLDALDGSKFYAAKSAGDGERRFTFAWIPRRKFGSNDEDFIWGGEFGSPREMIAMPDGSLTCKLPAEVAASYTNEQDFELIPGDGDWDGTRCDARGSFGFAHIKTARTDLMLEVEIACDPNTMNAGILMEPTDDMYQGHLLMVEPGRKRTSIRRWPIQWEPFWQAWVPGSPELGPDMARPMLVDQFLYSEPEDGKYQIRILRNGQLVECYVNDEVVMSYRIYEESETMFGFFVDQGAVSFNNLCIKT